MELYWYNINKF